MEAGIEKPVVPDPVKDGEPPPPAAPLKKKRGRPRKEDAAQKDAVEAEALAKKREEDAKALAVFIAEYIALPFRLAAKRDPKWELSKEEKAGLSLHTARLGVKWLPSIENWKEEIAFAVCVGGILIARVGHADKSSEGAGGSRDSRSQGTGKEPTPPGDSQKPPEKQAPGS